MALSATQFIIQRLREYDPNRTVAPGTAWYELMVAPLTAILQPIRDDVASLTASQTVLQVIEAVDPNAFSEAVLDAMMSTLLVDRRMGSRGTTTVRIRFFSAEAFAADAADLTFSTTTGLAFENTIAQSFTASQINTNFDGQFYYVDVPVQSSTEGSGFNVEIGEISVMTAEPANVVDVANVSAVSDGVTRETNLELIARARQEITVRALVSSPGIFSTITNNFSSIRSVAPVGFGDEEMMRDIIYNAHVGGYVDAWVKPQSMTLKTWTGKAGLVADTTRQVPVSTQVAFDTVAAGAPELVTRNLRHEDIATGTVVVTSQNGAFPYTDVTDYTIDYGNGTITPTAAHAGGIAYLETATLNPQDGSTLAGVFTDNNANFPVSNVRVGDRLVMNAALYGGSVGSEVLDGVYTVAGVAANSISIVGSFPVDVPSFIGAGWAAPGVVGYAVYGRVIVSYSYHPTSLDFAAVARTGRGEFTITDVPMLKVMQIEVLDPVSGDPTGVFLDYGGGWGSGGWGSGGWGAGALGDWRIRVIKPNERYSMIEDVFIDFSPAQKGVTVAVTFNYSPDVAAIHTYARDPGNRVVAGDILPKHMIPAFFNAVIPYESLASDATTTAATMLAALELFIHSLPSGATSRLEMSDVVDAMYDAGAVKVTLPIVGKLEIHNTDGSITVITDEDVLTVPTSILTDPTARPLSARTAHALPGTITLTQTPAAV